MELDKHQIAIRERDFGEVLDLALCVIRVYARPLVAALTIGIAPAFVFNIWLLWGFREMDFEFGFPARHMFFTLLLVCIEVPLATAPATLYLGQAVFSDKPEYRSIASNFLKSLPQLLLYQLLLRPVSVFSPFLNEVILLERNPLRAKGPGTMPTGRRCRNLHRNEGGDLFLQWMVATIVGGLLTGSIWYTIRVTRGFLLNQWTLDGPMFTVYFQLSLWIVVGYFCVVRFLNYLNLRIKHEGWDVELAMRAELARLSRGLT